MYMSTGEMGMMSAILMADGRYDDEASLIPLSFSDLVRNAANAHKKYDQGIAKMNAFKKHRIDGREAFMQEDNTKCQSMMSSKYDKETVRLYLDMCLKPVAHFKYDFDVLKKEYF